MSPVQPGLPLLIFTVIKQTAQLIYQTGKQTKYLNADVSRIPGLNIVNLFLLCITKGTLPH